MKLRKIISIFAAAVMLFTVLPFSAFAEEAEMRTAVVASKEKANPGDVITFDVKYMFTLSEPIYGLSFNLDIPDGLEFVDGSFAVNERTLAKLGLEEYKFTEDGDLPYYFYAAAGKDISAGSTSTGESTLGSFKCKVKNGAKGIFAVNTVNTSCVYLQGENAVRSPWTSEAAIVRVGVDTGSVTFPDITDTPDEKGKYCAYIGFADSTWSVQSWDSNTVIKEGENTLTFTLPKDKDGDTIPARGVSILVIDLLDCLYTVGYVRVTEILVDGEPISFNAANIIYGADDHSTADNYRVEIYSEYGETKNNSPLNSDQLKKMWIENELTIKFIVSSDKLADDDRVVYGKTISGVKDGAPLPLSGCNIGITDESGKKFTPVITGSRFDITLPRGHYTFTVSKKGFVTRTIENIGIGKSIPEHLRNIELNVFGDVSGDGGVDIVDASSIIMHINGAKVISDDYKAQVADCDLNGMIDIRDAVKVINQINGISLIEEK